MQVKSAMTIEHKLLISLEEIKAIVLECAAPDCTSRATFSPDKIDTIPSNCPQGHHWDVVTPSKRPEAGHPVSSWLRLLRNLRESTNQWGFKIFLEFDEPASHGAGDKD
jgi:hypothetical protein